MKGWYGHRLQHSLASRGISVKQLKDIKYFPEVINYEDPEEFIVAFWIASLKNDFSQYNFNKVFRYTKSVLIPRMNRYGYLSFDNFYYDFEADYNIGVLAEDYIGTYDWFTEKYGKEELKGNYSIEMAKDVYDIANQEREEYLSGVDPTYDRLFGVYNELQNEQKTLKEKIFLMDKLIDLQHHRGSIWSGESDNEYMLDIDKLRSEFESKYKVVR